MLNMLFFQHFENVEGSHFDSITSVDIRAVYKFGQSPNSYICEVFVLIKGLELKN